MSGWGSQDDPVWLTVQGLLLLVGGLLASWWSYRDAGGLTVADAVVGATIGALFVLTQVGTSLRRQAGDPLIGRAGGVIAGVLLVVVSDPLIDAYPAVAAAIFATVALVGTPGTVFLYHRARGA
jgi:hypothetical protein